MDTFEKIRALLAEQLDVDPAKITLESDIMSDFEADSLDIVDMVIRLVTRILHLLLLLVAQGSTIPVGNTIEE